jgi:hypothetical protein
MSNRRRTPSLSHVGLEGVTKRRVVRPAHDDPRPVGRKLTADEQLALTGSAEDAGGFRTDGHRVWTVENIAVGAGSTRDSQRPRVASTVGAMYRVGTVDAYDWQAGDALAVLLLRQLAPTEGVGSYGQNPGGADPTAKADRKGRQLTGYVVTRAGKVEVAPAAFTAARRNWSERRELAELLFSAAGVETADGRREFLKEKAIALVQCVLPSSNPPTLDQIGKRLTMYDGPKQRTAAAATEIRAMLTRMAVHLGLKKSAPWDERVSWAISEAEAGVK